MVRLEEHKLLTENKSIEALPLPAKVYIPLCQHIGTPCEPIVKVGDSVVVGQKIGTIEAKVWAPIHSSVSGKVSAIMDWLHPVVGQTKAVVVESDNSQNQEACNRRSQAEIERLTPAEIRNIIFEAGIVGMGGANFPTHIKLNPPKPVDTLIVNGAECEPYLASDYRLMVEKTEEILEGIKLAARCLKATRVIIAIEDNKPKAIEIFNGIRNTEYEIRILKSSYPQGGEKQLTKNILKKEIPQGKLPYEIGVVVQNVATLYAIYEAVYFNKPLYERVVTVTGSCVARPKNLLVRIGTSLKELIEASAPLKEEPAKMIIGGPMMGIAQFSSDTPVIKSTNGLILLNKKEAKAVEEEFCIRCGACVRECPSGLMPCLINLASQKWLWQEAKRYGASDCIECGICDYVCPANRMLVQSIKRAKLECAK